MRVKDIMNSQVITISPSATVGQAAQTMLERNVSCLPVVEADGRLVGILTHTDFGLHPQYLPLAGRLYTLLGRWASPKTLEEVAQGLRSVPVRDVMENTVVTVTEDTTLADATELMLRHRVHRLPVVRDGRVVGIVSRHDLLKLMLQDPPASGPANAKQRKQ
jgi:CBS domain-containing protein